MTEYLLIAVLHLYGDKLGPEMAFDTYSTEAECIYAAQTADVIVEKINSQWWSFMAEQRSLGRDVPPIESIGMWCRAIQTEERT